MSSLLLSSSAGFLLSLAAGAATGVGAALVFFFRRLTARWEDGLLSAAAGVMLAASIFSLLLPGVDAAESLGFLRPAAVAMVIGGLLVGAATIWGVHRFVPHEHFVGGHEGPEAARLARVWLFVLTITIHNFPEGMAVGVGAAGAAREALGLAIGIGLQNIPEGLAVAAALMSVGFRRRTAFAVSLLTGLLEGLGGAFGSLTRWLAAPLMPVTLGFAAGAMLYVISDEIIPETHGRGHKTLATFSLLIGFVVMMYMDATLG